MTNRPDDIVINYCKRWLEFIALVHIIGGVCLALKFPASVIEIYTNSLIKIFIADGIVLDDVKTLTEFLVRLFGPTIASWGILMFFIVQKITFDKKDNAQVSLIITLLVFFIPDTALSIYSGVYVHGALNFTALISILIPLFIIKSRH